MKKLASIVLACSLSQSAFAAQPLVLKRSAKWEFKYDEGSCRLSGKFGEGDDAVFATFTNYDASPGVALRLFGKNLPAAAGLRHDLTVDFEPFGNPRRMEGYFGKAGDLRFYYVGDVWLDDWSPPTSPSKTPVEDRNWPSPDQASLVKSIEVKFRASKSYHLETGGLRGPVELFQKCATDLYAHWGYDLPAMSGFQHGPRPVSAPGTWLKSGDYPSKTLIAGESAVIVFRLDVDAIGKVSRCAILEAMDPPEFAKVTCEKLKARAQFEPAIDAEGKPVPAPFVSSVRWLIHEH